MQAPAQALFFSSMAFSAGAVNMDLFPHTPLRKWFVLARLPGETRPPRWGLIDTMHRPNPTYNREATCNNIISAPPMCMLADAF